jgi:toxin CcdB
MARFDVYRNPAATAEATPYLLDIQSDWLDGLDTRVVVPLRRLDRFATVKLPDRLTPTFVIESMHCMLETPKLASVPVRLLRDKVINLSDHREVVTQALDFLLQGY